MRIAVIGAGAMGSLYGGLLARAGADVTLLDTWPAHVDAIGRDGLRLDGLGGDRRIEVAAAHPSAAAARIQVALVLTSAGATGEAAATAARVLEPDGYALTLQNGIGNVEALAAVLGEGRVLGGLSYHSAEVIGPGHVRHTHAGPTWLGELDGRRTPRVEALRDLLAEAGFAPVIVDDVRGYIWNKFVHNCAINALAAAAGLRVGEIPRHPEADLFQTRVVEETLAVVRARGIDLPDPDPLSSIKAFCRTKFNKPSMLQHVEQGKLTEIDALNGAVVREGRRLGIPTPFNEALTLLVTALARQRQATLHGPPVDYDRLEVEAKAALAHGTGGTSPPARVADGAAAGQAGAPATPPPASPSARAGPAAPGPADPELVSPAFREALAGLTEQRPSYRPDAPFHRCFGCGQGHPDGLRVRCFQTPDGVVSPIVVSRRYEGPPGTVHGGIVAAYLDEVLGGAVVRATGRSNVTGELTVRYVQPAPLETPILGHGRLVADHGRYVDVEGRLEELATGRLLATARGRFFPIPPR
jgi:2-dehydropantoate 2-reductase